MKWLYCFLFSLIMSLAFSTVHIDSYGSGEAALVVHSEYELPNSAFELLKEKLAEHSSLGEDNKKASNSNLQWKMIFAQREQQASAEKHRASLSRYFTNRIEHKDWEVLLSHFVGNSSAMPVLIRLCQHPTLMIKTCTSGFAIKPFLKELKISKVDFYLPLENSPEYYVQDFEYEAYTIYADFTNEETVRRVAKFCERFLDFTKEQMLSRRQQRATKVMLASINKTLPENLQIKEYQLLDFMSQLQNFLYEEELLILVNKNNFLPAEYTPKNLIYVNSILSTTKPMGFISKRMEADLRAMQKKAVEEKIKLIAISVYRSYHNQEQVFDYWVRTLGEAQAELVSAKPGTSQHQLATVIDFNMLEERFEQTIEGEWLFDNAPNFGFILSYPKGMQDFTGYSFEPWHYRYIGRDAACFVDNFFEGSLEAFLRWYDFLKY